MAKPVEKIQKPESAEVGRREFLRRALGGVVTPSVIGLVAACSDVERADPTGTTLGRRTAPLPNAGLGEGGYGPLTEDKGALILPKGFQLRSFGKVRDRMSDGNPTPLAHDGMAAFPGGRNRIRLVRNHEDRNGANPGSAIAGGGNAYDPVAGGGTTTLVVGPNRKLEGDFVSLNGTTVNCAGGPTPWGSWLSCEETAVGPNDSDGGSVTFEKTHGWVFEVPASANGPVEPVPILDMGRFSHEAVAIDPRTYIVYETEDNGFTVPGDDTRPGSGLYRFLPNNPTRLHEGGRLQMMKVKGQENALLIGNTGDSSEVPVAVGSTLKVEWVDIPDPTLGHTDFRTESRPELNDDQRKAAVFLQGWERGAAAFERLEGCWFGDGSLFFHDTSAGAAGEGRVWQYTPAAGEGSGGADDSGTLRLVFESPGPDVLEGPDNITVSPRGGLVLCEDGSGTQFLRGLTQSGQIFDFAINNINDTEFAGATFSPDGKTLFVNIQGSTRGSLADAETGITLALWGPWPKGAL